MVVQIQTLSAVLEIHRTIQLSPETVPRFSWTCQAVHSCVASSLKDVVLLTGLSQGE